MQSRKIKLEHVPHKQAIQSLVFFFCLLQVMTIQAQQGLIRYVQPLSGTAPAETPAARLHSEAGSEMNANTIPAVAPPFAMTQWTAQTRVTENKCVPPYFYKDTRFFGFRGSHWLNGSCTQDYGSLSVMPLTGHLSTGIKENGIPFLHANETLSPALYSIQLPEKKLTASITATERCGMMEFFLSQADSLYLLISPNSEKGKGNIHVNPVTGEIWGYNPAYRIYQGSGQPAGFSGWFYIQVEKTISNSGVFREKNIFRADSIRDDWNIGVYIGFQLQQNEKLRIRIGTSFSSLAAAKQNLQKEMPHWNFTHIAKETELQWEKRLAQVTVEKGGEQEKRIFYTALYHAMQHPRLFSDVDGSYPSFAGNTSLQKMQGGNYYDDFSFWDIYRAQLPLLEILDTALVSQFVRSVIQKGQQGGWLPIFPCWNSYTAAMIGDHASAFIASAYNKGIRGFDAEQAYTLMRRNAFDAPNEKEYRNGMGRRALHAYLQYGYIPLEDTVPFAFHKREQVSRTLEYAFDDYAVATLAYALHKKADYQVLSQRAQNYKHVFDPQTGMMRGRYANGQWYMPFEADRRAPYITEGTPRQYSFYVPQDMEGLRALMGGAGKLEQSLDSLFLKQQYWHGNEPGHQVPFLYNYTNAPWKTQEAVAKILREEYSDGPGGLSGNDDAGQMSAWYVFAAMGFYPVNPVSNDYAVCTPLFEELTLHMPNGKALRIHTHAAGRHSRKIRKMLWNGKKMDQYFLSYPMLMGGGLWELWLTD